MAKKSPAGSTVPKAIKKYNKAHPKAKNAHNSYGKNASKGKGK
jgi:hypothetical protein